MKKSKIAFLTLTGFLLTIGLLNTTIAVTWGVCNGDDLEYKATKYTDTIFTPDQTLTMTVTFNVTSVGDSVTADRREDGGTAVSVYLNTQSLDPLYGINIKTTNNIFVRYLADEQRIQSLMAQIQTYIGGVLSNFSMSRSGNNLLISAYGGPPSNSWTYDAEINYTSDYVLSRMSEDHFQTNGVDDAVQTVLWTKVHHHSACTTPGPSIPGFPAPAIIGVIVAAVVGVIVINYKKRMKLSLNIF